MREVEGFTQSAVESQPLKPMFIISEKDLPEVDGFEVSKEYNIEIKAKMTGLQDVDDLSPREATFEITGVEVLDKGVWDKSAEEFKEMKVDAKST